MIRPSSLSPPLLLPFPSSRPLCIYEQYTVSLPVIGEVYDHPNSCAERGTGNEARTHTYTIRDCLASEK